VTPSENAWAEGPSLRVSTPAGPAAPAAGELTVVIGSLHQTYDERWGAAVVDTEIQRVAELFSEARIRSFVPLFVQPYVGAMLRPWRVATVVSREG
jgi:hypothetical protein